jgi:Mn2+/Fe2+ NRAMP family transporter
MFCSRAFCVVLQIVVQYRRYVSVLKWLTLSLFAYFGTVLVANVPWGEMLHGLFLPALSATTVFWTSAILGTTISPYLFFWRASQEVEDIAATPVREPLKRAPQQAESLLERIRLDTYVGNLVAIAIMVTAAATLHAEGITNIQTSSPAAEALRPIADDSPPPLGILGTGLLAVPVLAGSAAYAIGEAGKWPTGLARQPLQAKAF